jgi:hypothetical protein
VSSLDARTVLRLGGWDVRYTTVLFVAEREDLAIALLDADSDLNLDDFERHSDGTWHQGAASGSAPDTGPGMQGRVVYDYGQAAAGTPIVVDYQGETHTVITAENGWWAFVARFDPEQPDSLPVRRASTSQAPVMLRSRRWRRTVWRWPTATPPIVAPSRPPVFLESGVATGSRQFLQPADPSRTFWVRLPSWMVADGEPPEPAVGTILRNLGVRAVASQVRAASTGDGVRALLHGPGVPIAYEYEITGLADDIRSFDVEVHPEPVRTITEFLLSAQGIEFWVQTDVKSASVAAGSQVTATCRLSVIGNYEWEAFALADVRADWVVREVVRLGEDPGQDFMLLLERVSD